MKKGIFLVAITLIMVASLSLKAKAETCDPAFKKMEVYHCETTMVNDKEECFVWEKLSPATCEITGLMTKENNQYIVLIGPKEFSDYGYAWQCDQRLINGGLERNKFDPWFHPDYTMSKLKGLSDSDIFTKFNKDFAEKGKALSWSARYAIGYYADKPYTQSCQVFNKDKNMTLVKMSVENKGSGAKPKEAAAAGNKSVDSDKKGNPLKKLFGK